MRYRGFYGEEDSMSNKTKKGSNKGFRTITELGCIELPQERAKIQAKMFQFMKTKKGGKRK